MTTQQPEALQARIKTMAEEHADELMVAHLDGRSQAAQQPAPSAAAHKACKPDMLVNSGALKLALNVLRRAGKHEVADELEATAQPTPTPQADSQPAPVLTSETGGDWTQPTPVALRLGDAMQLLCGGKRPPDDMVQQWLDNTSESLQEFAASNGPAWAQGIGLIDAAMVMVDQPTEITTIDSPDRDHEHRAARAPADSVLKDHQIAALVNELRDIAIQHHGTQQLRERIARAVVPALNAQAADSVLEDAARWQMAALIGNEVMLHPDKRTNPAAVKAYMDAVHSGLDLTGAIDAALASQEGKSHGN